MRGASLKCEARLTHPPTQVVLTRCRVPRLPRDQPAHARSASTLLQSGRAECTSTNPSESAQSSQCPIAANSSLLQLERKALAPEAARCRRLYIPCDRESTRLSLLRLRFSVDAFRRRPTTSTRSHSRARARRESLPSRDMCPLLLK